LCLASRATHLTEQVITVGGAEQPDADDEEVSTVAPGYAELAELRAALA
jgi:hypothetical protein